MKLPHLLFLNLLLLCAVLAWGWTRPQAPNAGGVPHSEISAMLEGGDGWSRFEPVQLPAFFYGVLSITFFVGLLAFGLQRKGGMRVEWGPFLAALFVYLGVFVLFFLSYRTFAMNQASSGIGPLVLGFPKPTAWMLYGLYGAPLLFTLLYWFKFEKWIYTAEDEAEFKALVERTKQAREEGA